MNSRRLKHGRFRNAGERRRRGHRLGNWRDTRVEDCRNFTRAQRMLAANSRRVFVTPIIENNTFSSLARTHTVTVKVAYRHVAPTDATHSDSATHAELNALAHRLT